MADETMSESDFVDSIHASSTMPTETAAADVASPVVEGHVVSDGASATARPRSMTCPEKMPPPSTPPTMTSSASSLIDRREKQDGGKEEKTTKR